VAATIIRVVGVERACGGVQKAAGSRRRRGPEGGGVQKAAGSGGRRGREGGAGSKRRAAGVQKNWCGFSRLEPAQFAGYPDGVDPVAGTGFRDRAGQVVADGTGREAEARRDLGGAGSLSGLP
jgi:hypothetical protein